MKLRIQGQQLRLRLSRDEVIQLARGEALIHQSWLGPGPSPQLDLEVVAGEAQGARWRDGRLTLTLERAPLSAWPDDQREGFSFEAFSQSTHPLAVTIEKDYKCTTPKDSCDAQGDAARFDWPKE